MACRVEEKGVGGKKMNCSLRRTEKKGLKELHKSPGGHMKAEYKLLEEKTTDHKENS